MLTLVADAPTGGKSRGILRWIPPASTYWRRISFPAHRGIPHRCGYRKLTATGEVLQLPSPVCVAFLVKR